MSVLRYFIIIGILAVGVYVFSCTSPTEAPSPESTEINTHTDSLLQFRIYLEQARISRFKGENQEEAHFLDAAENIAQCLNDSSVYANLWQEKAMLYLPHQPEKAKEFFQKALAYMPSGTPVSIAQSELYLSRIYLEQGQTYNPQIQISVVSGTKRSIFRQKNKTKRSKKKAAHNTYKAGAKG